MQVRAWACVAAVALAAMAVSLPTYGFFSGDPGLKLAAALNAASHPSRPFDFDLPRAGGRVIPAVDPMVSVHGDHAHPIQSPVFPVVSAPLIAVFGLRAALLLPALSFVLLVPLLEAIRRQAVPDCSPGLLAMLAVIANPLLFYALEFWEHAPAVALLAAATALAFRDRPAAAGACAAAAMLLRPESAWYAGALLLCVSPRAALRIVAGAAVVLAPFAIASYAHSGNPLGPHITTVLAPLGDAWLAGRWSRIDVWLWPASTAVVLGLVIIGAAWVLRAAGQPVVVQTLVGLAGVVCIAVASSAQWIARESLWGAFPLAALAFVPSPGAWIGERRLWLLSLVTAAGVVLTATHDGGAQWGPRFLLIVTPPMMLIAARRATLATAAGSMRVWRAAAVAAVVIACAITSRDAFRELRASKVFYARLVDEMRALTTPDAPVVTNVWWLDQVGGSLYGSRTFLYGGSRERVSGLLRQASAVASDVTLVWTREADGEALDAAASATCYRITAVHVIPERRLTFASAHCARPVR